MTGLRKYPLTGEMAVITAGKQPGRKTERGGESAHIGPQRRVRDDTVTLQLGPRSFATP